MLEPGERRHLLEALRPPEGYELSCAVGTTFSLDLLTLLTVPLAFTFFGWEDEAGRPTADPLAILEALRRHADRISVFCQAGQIAIPKADQLLYSYLEGSVFEVKATDPQGVFHPKLWILRFAAPDNPVLYRVLCLSRNLTFDRSWDTALVLDGALTGRQRAYAANHPLGDFVSALPGLALRAVPDRVQKQIDLVQDELRRVRFELPDGFKEIRFRPLGIDGRYPWPFEERIDRIAVVSPFVSEECLAWLTEQGSGNVLISRLESLEALDPDSLKNFKKVLFLSPEAVGEEDTPEESDGDANIPVASLHAKLYIAETGWDARLWTGSANATTAAFERNVEFLVEMTAKKSRFGVDAFLGQEKGKASFADLLQEFLPAESASPKDAELERLQCKADDARRQLAVARLTAHVFPLETAGLYCVHLHAPNRDLVALPPNATAHCWPITLPEAAAISLQPGPGLAAKFEQLSFEALTPFFAFDVEVNAGERRARSRFVLNLPLEGAPAGRQERILHSLLSNKEQVLRFLLFILAEGDEDVLGLVSDPTAPGSGELERQSNAGAALSLFEPLVRALERDPARLDQVARLVEDLKKAPAGRDLLPEGFDTIWEPIWSARQRMRQ